MNTIVTPAMSLLKKLTNRFGTTMSATHMQQMVHKAVLELGTDEEIQDFLQAGFHIYGQQPHVPHWDIAFAHRPRAATCFLGALEDVASTPLQPADFLDPRRLGTRVWDWTYRWLPDDDQNACAVTAAFLGPTANATLLEYDKLRVSGFARWVDGACTTLTCGHKLFASLAMTAISVDSYQDIHLPWPAFVVQIPDRLLYSGEAECKLIRFAFLRQAIRFGDVHAPPSDAAVLTVETDHDEFLHCARWGPTALERCLFDANVADETLTSQEDRAIRVAQKVVVGLLYTMQYTNNFKERLCGTAGRPSVHRGSPGHRLIQFGSPIKVDVRETFQQWMKHGDGHHAPPSVQSLIRGHYKRQVVGVGRGGRKVIWVEPYWRGPEDAPILMRPKTVGA